MASISQPFQASNYIHTYLYMYVFICFFSFYVLEIHEAVALMLDLLVKNIL